jgi:hypothetical protein
MAYRSFRGGSGRLDTRLDTPPSINRRHPDSGLAHNESRPHQGRWCFGKTPMQTFRDALPMTKEKMIAA